MVVLSHAQVHVAERVQQVGTDLRRVSRLASDTFFGPSQHLIDVEGVPLRCERVGLAEEFGQQHHDLLFLRQLPLSPVPLARRRPLLRR